MQRDSTGFPLSVKPSHLFDPVEQMSMAEILAMIVEQACLYEPDSPVGKSFKRPKAHFRSAKVPNEALTDEEKVSKETFLKVVVPKEAPKAEKVSVASDLVRF